MRRLNLILVAGMLVSFLVHAIIGSMQLMGAQSNLRALMIAADFLVAFMAAHVVVSIIFSIRTLKAIKKSGAHYFKDNLLFWARRISGLTIIIPMIMHLVIFHSSNESAYRLSAFTAGRMISQILLVASIALHVLINVKPALMGFGVKGHRKFAGDIIFVLTILLFVFAVSFLVYFLRWAAN